MSQLSLTRIDPAEWHTAPLIIGTHKVVSPCLRHLEGARAGAWRFIEECQMRDDPQLIADGRRWMTRTYGVRWAPLEDRRLARELAAPGSATQAQILARVNLYGGLCWMCRVPYEAVDHVKPLAKGGSNWPANLRPICRSCNSRKGARWPL